MWENGRMWWRRDTQADYVLFPPPGPKRDTLGQWWARPRWQKRRFFWCFWMRGALKLTRWLHPDDVEVRVYRRSPKGN